MKLSESEIKQVLNFVKKEPRTVQDISRLIKRSWVTTDSYLAQIKEKTGLIDIKTFRAGSQGALKVVFYASADTISSDDIKENIFSHIKHSRAKQDFDFLEIFQFVPEKNKRCFLEEYDDENVSKNQNFISLLSQAKSQILVLSGNLSFINMIEKNHKIIDLIEELLKRKVMIKILCRVNIASISNINKLIPLMKKYPDLIEIHHRYHPLRGFIIDDKIARFKDEESLAKYKKGELRKNTRIFYEIFDDEWVSWLTKVFFAMFRSSIDYDMRIKEINKIF